MSFVTWFFGPVSYRLLYSYQSHRSPRPLPLRNFGFPNFRTNIILVPTLYPVFQFLPSFKITEVFPSQFFFNNIITSLRVEKSLTRNESFHKKDPWGYISTLFSPSDQPLLGRRVKGDRWSKGGSTVELLWGSLGLPRPQLTFEDSVTSVLYLLNPSTPLFVVVFR